MYGLPSFVLRDIPQYCRVWQVVPEGLENTGRGGDRFKSPLPLLIADEIGGVPVGRGG